MELGMRSVTLGLGLLVLSGCGGGSTGEVDPAALSPPALTVGYGIKQLQFSWPAVPGATHYKLFERIDPSGAFSQLATDLTTTSFAHEIAVHWRSSASYRVDACNATGCIGSEPRSLAENLVPAIGYLKSSHYGIPLDDFGDAFGSAVVLSGDGNTLAVGVPYEDGPPVQSAAHSGAVYVFARTGGTWSQQSYLRASNAGGWDDTSRIPPQGDFFGRAIAISADGNTLAVGAPGEDSSAVGIDGDQSSNASLNSGAVYVFTRSGGAWSQQAYVKASNTGGLPAMCCAPGDLFGSSVALSADGNTLAVGAPGEDSNAVGVNGNQLDNSAESSGAVYVFTRTSGTWSQQAYVKASNSDIGDLFGTAVALSGDGEMLAVGADSEDSSATGIGGNQADNSAINAGAVYIFARTAGSWSQRAYVKASNANANDFFGRDLALSQDGTVLAVGATGESSSSRVINGDEGDNSAISTGAVYVLSRAADVWVQQAYLKASNAESGDSLGTALALSGDGTVLAVGAPSESSSAKGIGGNQGDNTAPSAGATYVFRRVADTWSQGAYVKASNSLQRDRFGEAVALNQDGNTLVVGAPGETGGATGIGGDQSLRGFWWAGAVYLY